MKLQDCNPFLRAAQIQAAVMEGNTWRQAYDHRLFYILKGEGSLFLRNATYDLAPDTVLFFRPGTGYYFKGRMRVVVLNFDLTRSEAHRAEPICPPPLEEFDPAFVFDTEVLDEQKEPLIFPNGLYLREDILRLANTFRRKDPLADAITSALLKKLLVDLIGGANWEQEPGSALVHRVERHIELYAAEIRDNEQIGEAFGYHPVYIASLFKETTGRSLHQAVLNRRIELACRWLNCTDNSIEEIAFDTGFSSRSHFCTVFKKQMGCSPQQYRKNKKQVCI